MNKPMSLIHVYMLSLVLIIFLVFPVLGFFWVKQEVGDFRAKSDELSYMIGNAEAKVLIDTVRDNPNTDVVEITTNLLAP